MSMVPDSRSQLSYARTARKLAKQRHAGEVARGRAAAAQLKMICAISGVFAVVVAYGIYRGFVGLNNTERLDSQIPLTITNPGSKPSDMQVGQIRLPYKGEVCRELQFDNKTGGFGGESFAQCYKDEAPAIDASKPAVGARERARALGDGFRIK